MKKSKIALRRVPFVPSFRRCLLLLLPAVALASVGIAQDQGPTHPERSWPVAVKLADVRMTGELSKRLSASFDRLEEGFYSPPGLYDSPNDGWPGDKEGRTLLGLVLLEQVTGRPAKHLEASLDMYSRRVNAQGYLGPVMVPDAIHEQTLGGQFWVLNALYEYEASKKNGRARAWADQILNAIYLAAADAYPRYPITPAERVSQSFTLADGRTGKWDLAPMDIGCGMAGSLDALTDAYARHPSKETGRVLDTVIKRWTEIELEAIHAQLHSTLISTRSLLRHFETTGRKELLQVATDRYRLYREKAMSDNFENHNWFGRPEWTEGCAVVDSFIIAVQLWRFTGEATYLEDAHRIYYNGLSVNQRSNGGLGCNSCPSLEKPFLTVISQEATQCCTMRGADGLTKAAQYCFFKNEKGVIVPFYQNAEATLRWGKQALTLLETTGYPWQGEVRLEVTAAQGDEPRTLSLLIPSWAERPVLRLNGQVLSVTSHGGFLDVSRRWRAGDVVELSFEQSVAAKAPVNRVNGADRGDYRTFHFGPLMLGHTGPNAVTVKSDARFSRRGDRDFLVEGTDLVLQPIYHLLDPAVSKNRDYRRQVLFPYKGS